MKICVVCKKNLYKVNRPAFRVPKCEKKRKKWSAICRMALTKTSRLCIDHFSQSQVITAGRNYRLMPNAEPVMQNQQNEVLAGLLDAYDHGQPSQEYSEVTEIPMEMESANVGLFQEQQIQADSSICYDDINYHRNKIKELELQNNELKCQPAQTHLAVDSTKKIFTDGQSRKLMNTAMLDDLCRICAKTIRGEDALGLFGNENNILLLKIKDLTGVQLSNETGLPKRICLDCNSDILEVYKKFREDFLKVQASFEFQIRVYEQQKCNSIINESEFVQICAVEEETDTSVSDYEPIFEEEKEINTRSNEILSFAHTNDFEINSCNDNALQDTKNAVEDNGAKVEYNIDEIETFNDLEEEVNEIRQIDEKFWEPIKKLNDDKENPKMFLCDQCGRQFNCSTTLNIHLNRHFGVKPYACELCPNKFTVKAELRLHMRKHTGERPYSCKFCGRRFKTGSKRNAHQRTHTNERPYMCHLCGKSFTINELLKKHMLSHTGEKKFKCDLCNREFGRKDNLILHFKSKMHKEAIELDKFGGQIECKTEKRYECSMCDKWFKAPYILRNHILTHTGVKDFKCVACNKAFARKSQLDAHFTTKIHKQTFASQIHDEFIMNSPWTVENIEFLEFQE